MDNKITHGISDGQKIPEKEKIPLECNIILAVSTLLSTPSEIASSTILNADECLRRMAEIAAGRSEMPTLKDVNLAKFEGNPSNWIAAFGKPARPSRITIVESPSDEPKEECKEPPVPLASRRLKLPPTLIDQMKLCTSNIDARLEHSRKLKKISLSPPPKKFPKLQKGILRSSSTYPVRKLGRQSTRKSVTANRLKPIDDSSLDIFRTFIAYKKQCEKGSQKTFPEWKKTYEIENKENHSTIIKHINSLNNTM